MARDKGLCKVCTKKDHDQCPLVNGCSCCEQTKEQMRESNLDSDDEDSE